MYISERLSLLEKSVIFFPACNNKFDLPKYFCSFSELDKNSEPNKSHEDKNKSGHEKKCSLKGLKVLIVEDNMVNQKVLELMLKKEGLGVCIAENGLECIDILKGSDFDIIFMDIQMPVMDGLTATKKIRDGEAGESKKHIPIVAVTAHTSSIEEINCMEAGMNDFMTKPVSQDMLKIIVKKYCN